MRFYSRYITSFLAVLAIVGLLGTLWPLTMHAAASQDDTTNCVLGWLCLLFIIATLAAVGTTVWTRSRCVVDVDAASPAATENLSRKWLPAPRFFRCSLLIDGLGILLIIIAVATHTFTIKDAARIYCVLVGWVALWCGLAACVQGLNRRAPRLSGSHTGPAIAIPMMLAATLFGGPITLRPLVRIAAAHTPTLEAPLVKIIAIATPMLAVLDSIKDSIAVSWETLPEMYRLSGLGQDVPMNLPHWWLTALLLGSAGAALSLVAAWRDRH